MLTDKDVERLKKRWIRYPGFGRELTAGEWAQQLGIPRTTLWRYLKEGLTIEQIAEIRVPDFEGVQKVVQRRRTGKRMLETEELMFELLAVSGYNADNLEIKPMPNRPSHVIKLEGSVIGVYRYEDDVLDLSGGERLRLKDPIVDLQAIKQNGRGLWEIHPDTRKAMFRARERENIE